MKTVNQELLSWLGVCVPSPESGGAAGRRVRVLSEPAKSLSHADRQLRSQSPHKDTADR